MQSFFFFWKHCENLASLICNSNRILIMCRKLSVYRCYCPVIIKPVNIIGSFIDHRLDRKCHSLLHLSASSSLHKVRNLRCFMKLRSNSMPCQITHNRISVTFRISLNTSCNVN